MIVAKMKTSPSPASRDVPLHEYREGKDEVYYLYGEKKDPGTKGKGVWLQSDIWRDERSKSEGEGPDGKGK